jgi:ligand-binding sensor domain-containing protein
VTDDKKISLIAVLFFFLLRMPVFGSDRNRVVQQITTEQGLSQNSVNCILQDSRGFLWLGTQEGLNRYDGTGFVIFKNDPLEPASISDSYVTALFEDRAGTLWAGTNGMGLYKMLPALIQFRRFSHSPDDPGSLNHKNIFALYEDHTGVLWAGTQGGRSECPSAGDLSVCSFALWFTGRRSYS